MPVEVPPVSGALWLDNWILSATVAAASSQRSGYPADNLLSPLRSSTYRSNDSTSDTYVVFDMGEIRTPVAFGLADINFSTGTDPADGAVSGTKIRLRGSDDAAQSINAVYWDLPLYQQDAVGRVLRWYPGNPTSGSIGSSTNPGSAAAARGRQFWGVRILPATFGSYNVPDGDDFFEIGVPWFGLYVPFRPWAGIRPKPKNQSNRTKAYGLAQWTDPLPVSRQVDVPTGGLTIPAYYDLEAKILVQGSKHTMLDLYAATSDPILKRGGCMYGYFAEDPIQGDIGSPEANTLNFQFEEASG